MKLLKNLCDSILKTSVNTSVPTTGNGQGDSNINVIGDNNQIRIDNAIQSPDLPKAEEKCRQLEAQLRSPQAEVAAKFARLRSMTLDDAIAAKMSMAEKEKKAEQRRQEAAYSGLSPHLRKMVDELSAKCLAELNKGTA